MWYSLRSECCLKDQWNSVLCGMSPQRHTVMRAESLNSLKRKLSIARQQLDKHSSATKIWTSHSRGACGPLLSNMVFSMLSVPRLYSKATGQVIVSHSQWVATWWPAVRWYPASNNVSMEAENIVEVYCQAAHSEDIEGLEHAILIVTYSYEW